MRIKTILFLSAFFTILLIPRFAMATPGLLRIASTSLGGHTVIVPPHAVEIASGIFSLGSAIDVDGTAVEGYMFVYKKNAPARPDKPGKPGGKGKTECSAFLSKGAKWKDQEPYMIDPANTQGLNSSFLSAIIGADINDWETEANYDVFANEIANTVDGMDTVSPDNKNEIMFGDINSQGTVAVTVVWGIFGGPPGGRELREFDMMFDQADYGWANNEDPTKMDFQNVEKHEMGHAFGMGHPDDTCVDETMFRFVGFGEIIKRTLNAGDIAGILSLYK